MACLEILAGIRWGPCAGRMAWRAALGSLSRLLARVLADQQPVHWRRPAAARRAEARAAPGPRLLPPPSRLYIAQAAQPVTVAAAVSAHDTTHDLRASAEERRRAVGEELSSVVDGTVTSVCDRGRPLSAEEAAAPALAACGRLERLGLRSRQLQAECGESEREELEERAAAAAAEKHAAHRFLHDLFPAAAARVCFVGQLINIRGRRRVHVRSCQA
eukprot:tig00000237_g20466.t1